MPEVCGDYVVLNPYVWVKNACVVFKERIEEIYQLGSEVGEALKSTVITHGLASTHTHLGLHQIRLSVSEGLTLNEWVEHRAWPWERFLKENPQLTYYVVLNALRDLVESGVTLVADMHFNEFWVYKALTEVGVKGDLSVAIMDGGVFENFEEGFEENIELAKKASDPKVRIRLGPCTPRLLTPLQYKKVVETAEELGLGIHTHIAEVFDDELWLKSKYGMSLRDFINYVGLGNVDTLAAHLVWGESVIDLLSLYGVKVSHPPRSNTLLGDGRAPIKSYLRRGVRVSLGVDVAPTYSLVDDMRAYLILHYEGEGIPQTQEVFKIATVNGYRDLGFGSGELIPEEPADIVVWELPKDVINFGFNPITSIVWGGAKAREVYVNGVKVFENGNLLNVSVSLEFINAKIKEYLKDFKYEGVNP